MKTIPLEQFEELKEFLLQNQRDLMLANTQSTHSEVSGLHGEILRKIKDIKDTVDSHDVTIKTIPTFFGEVNNFIKRAEPAVKTFENISWSGRTIVKTMVIIGIVCGGVVGLKELVHNLIK